MHGSSSVMVVFFRATRHAPPLQLIIILRIAPPFTFQCYDSCEAQSPDPSLEWSGDHTSENL